MVTGYLIGRRELGPRFVGTAIVVVSVRDLHVLMETEDLSGL